MPEESGGEKTLPPSPLKIRRARERGQVAKSQDLTAAWSLLVALITLRLMGFHFLEDLVKTMRHYFQIASDTHLTVHNIQFFTIEVLWNAGKILLPFMGLMLFAGLSGNFSQVGFLVAPQALMPQFERLNPFTGLAKFFSLRSFVELVKSILKLGVIGYVVYGALYAHWTEVMILPYLSPMEITLTLARVVGAAWFRVVLVMLTIGILDYGFQRWQYMQDLRMTVKEAKEELKELEGDPQIKQRVRQIQRQMAMQRMLQEVPEADVVITNPTTYAVALRYHPEKMNAPMVTAKGARLVAARIRELAIENDVPIVEKPELARALFRTVELNAFVPETLFQAVADVLQFVYQIDQREEKRKERAQIFRNARAAGAA